jgi:putative addiction module component (TIGR02574 family)
MVDQTLLAQVNKLSPVERLELIGAIWDALPHAKLPVTEAEKQLLDARLADAEANPEDESPLSDVAARLERRGH